MKIPYKNNCTHLNERILTCCSKVMEPEVSVETRYNCLKKLLENFIGLESIYARNVFMAIQRECRKIEEGIRLKVEIINQDQVINDGCVYYVISNIGNKFVSIQSECIKILLKQEHHPEIIVEANSICDLQPGFVTGGKSKLVLQGFERVVPVKISVTYELSGGSQLVLCDDEKQMIVQSSEEFMQVTRRNKYDVRSAVVDANRLFGRDALKEELEYNIPLGVTVIYGPSRIGKTSLLNWVRNDYALKCGNVMTILFGGEGGLGKEKDYKENFIDNNLPVPYDDDKQMTEYLLVGSIIQSMTKMTRRLKKPSRSEVNREIIVQIIEILNNDNLTVVDRYYELDSILNLHDLQLWILLDEFQQVVERWKPNDTCEFVQICKMLMYDGLNHSIKLVISGSDDLLKHMVIEDDSVWRKAFPSDSTIAVEALEKTPFGEMVQYDKGIKSSNIVFSNSSIDALFTYTGGIALYGKEICNTIIDDIIAYPEKYRRRNVIYVSDVAYATQKLLNKQASELDMKAKEGIREIYDAVTNNLRQDTDMQYLWYIAKWIFSNPDKIAFPEKIFVESGNLRDEKQLHESLSIAEARGIIKKINTDPYSENEYVFRTIFYYYAFLGSAYNNLDENKIFRLDFENDSDALSWVDQVIQIVSAQSVVERTDIAKIIDSLNDEELKTGIGQIYGKGYTIHADTYIEENTGINAKEEKKVENNNWISGNASDVQIQQGTKKSSQVINNAERINYETALEIVNSIMRSEKYFDSEFGERSSELLKALDDANAAIRKKDDSKLKTAWDAIKNVASNTAGSLIANGIIFELSKLVF